MMMDKLTIKCMGDVKEVLNTPTESLAGYFWDRDIEVTHIHNFIEDSESTILFYGFEMINGLIDKILDKRRKNNLYSYLKDNNIEVIDIKFEQCNDDEFMQYIEE